MYLYISINSRLTPRPRGQDKDEDLWVEVEPVHELLPVLRLCRAVKAQVGEAHHADPRLEHVQHLCHLRFEEAEETGQKWG